MISSDYSGVSIAAPPSVAVPAQSRLPVHHGAMRMAIVAPTLPPALNGIGDYTGMLTAELAEAGHAVSLIVRQDSQAETQRAIFNGTADVLKVFDADRPATCRAIFDVIVHMRPRPQWLILQYNPFSYGRRGMNLVLPSVLRDVSVRLGLRVAVMFHEVYVPITHWKFAVMTTWQRWQFCQLARAADVLLFSIEPWVRRYRRWFSSKPMFHLPVGSNVPNLRLRHGEARQRLGLGDDEVVLGVFGTAHVSRSLALVRAAADAVRARDRSVRILYIGPDGAKVRAALGELPAITDGPHDAAEVSRRLSAIDVFLATYSDGVSTRRGAMTAALQHGLPIVGTHSQDTDPELRDQDGKALTLVPAGDTAAFSTAVADLVADADRRGRMRQDATALFERRYSWPVIAANLTDILRDIPLTSV